MQHFLRNLLVLTLSVTVITTKAQVTKLATGNNIEFGFPLGSVAVMFDNQGRLWKTDGTSSGTIQYSSKVTLAAIENLAVFNNKLYFAGSDAANGTELWVTDGTDAGTQLVKNIEAGAASSTPTDFIVFNNKLYFFATTAAAGKELWVSDGSTGGTNILLDINPGAAGSYDQSEFMSLGSNLFFTAKTATNGTELWKTNGTTGGTVLVKDIREGNAASSPSSLSAYNGAVYFSANDGTSGGELWKSDGTAAGTVRVKDIVSGAKSANPSEFHLFKNKLYFIAEKPQPFFTLYQLWVTDGTEAGTKIVYDYSIILAFPTLSLAVNFPDKFCFAVTAAEGIEVWSSDGTETGTTPLRDINTQGNDQALLFPDIYGAAFTGSDFHNRLFNGKLFMTADDGSTGNELWITNGTIDGTVLVKDINAGPASGITFTDFGFYTQSGFYFSAADGTHGLELWKSNGSDGGTAMVKDINPGAGGSFDRFILFFNGHVYFAADENNDGQTELFKVDQSEVLPLTLLEFTATPNGKATVLDWSTSNEINTKDFTVQRSYDGRQFDNIGTVKAAGNNSQKTSYQFTDAGAARAGVSKVYYRLQMNDNDGKYSFSKIVSVTLIPQDKLVIAYPNPVKDQLTLSFNIAAPAIAVKIIDQNGKVVYQQQLTNIVSGATHRINTGALSSGVYFVQWNTGKDVQSIKIVKN